MKITIKNTMKITIKNTMKNTMKITIKNTMKNTFKKKQFVIKKEMSFLNISDPTKRDPMVKEYLDLKKNIRDNLLSERTGEQQLQTDLSKFFKPITETQKLQREKLRKNLNLLKKVSRNYRRLLRFLPIHR